MHKVVSDYTSNEVSSSNIRVFVRARPPEDLDAKTDFIEAGGDENRRLVIKDPEVSNRKYSEVVFQFERVFWTDVRQDEIFEAVCRPQVDHILNGYNSCCFAYGQTGSGKTYSMFGGDGEVRGMIPRAAEYLFARLAGRSQKTFTREVATFCSFLEIYNDQLRDLGKAYLVTTGLEPSTSGALFEKTSDLFASIEKKRANPYFSKAFHKSGTARALATDEITPEIKQVQDEYNTMNYEIREDGTGNVFVKDLSLIPVTTTEEIMSVIALGLKVRAVADTKMNAASSRSHTVFTITVVQRDGLSAEALTGVLNLVDLAGSERLKKSDSQGNRLREALHINSSLTALGKVVMALDQTSETTHVPYRDSKLTRMLQNSLGGNSFTTVLANIHPSPAYYEECLSTLQFANRCRNVRNHPRVNYMGDTAEDKDRKIRRLTDEVSLLRSRIGMLEAGGGGGSFPMARLVALLHKVGVQATTTGEGDLVLDDGRVLSSEQLGLGDVNGSGSVASAAAHGGEDNENVPRPSLSSMSRRASKLMLTQQPTKESEAKLKKLITEMQMEMEGMRLKLKERKLEMEHLNQQVRRLITYIHNTYVHPYELLL